MSRPIFFDPTGRRRRRTRAGILVGLLLLVGVSLLFASTVVNMPVPRALPLGFERATPLRFRSQVSRISHSIGTLFRGPPKARLQGAAGKPLTVAFYATWSDDSGPSLIKHIDQIDWVAPTLLAIGKTGELEVNDDVKMRRIIAGHIHRPLVLPVLQNLIDGQFTGQASLNLLRDHAKHKQLITELNAYLDKSGDAGIIFDFENIPDNLLEEYRRLIAEINADFDKHGRLVAVTVPVDHPEWVPAKFAAVADKVFLMASDEHYGGGEPGPIASNAWFASHLANAMAAMPRDKAIIALGSYAYDWHDGKADSLTVGEALLMAHDSNSNPVFDSVSGNTGFSLLDQGHRHDVWMADAAASWNQMQILGQMGLNGVALWRLGSEDPGFWSVLSAWHGRTRPDMSRITQETAVDVEGQGEILRITATPNEGKRSVSYDTKTGFITHEQFDVLPTPYVVERTGARDKMVALTFDDGPDPVWTAQILSILEHYRVPASFFIVGENGVANRQLLQRMVADGYEIGNHSYTHPNMADDSETGIKLELNATQRLIQAYTGRSTHLFRAPYFGDAEPTTADELIPALIAQQHGYAVIGLHVDPGDWKRPGAKAIVDQTLAQVAAGTATRTANIILLHDGGGERSQTVAALPGIIEGLHARGYKIVTTAELAGLTSGQVMSPITGADLTAVQADVAIFTGIAAIFSALNWTFFFAIALGILRSLSLTGLALLPIRRQPPADLTYEPLVTVIIPAYNEERVIAASVRRILASDYARIEVIVADDGSSDNTSKIIAKSYGKNRQVTLMTMVNGGKASALNRALLVAKGEIIVALDADTQFESQTISRLVRWFADAKVGAVAGNAKVGNRVNIVTKWQAVEYITAQNIERRALTRFDAIMVVPGAVGAWRRSALDAVGGYSEDTLAEDQDLTIAIQRQRWKVVYDEDAVAWTEAPETLRSLGRQRYRWSYGTLQCLWKHRRILRERHPSGLAFIGIPQAWLFQIVFAVISPAIDLALLISIGGTVMRVIQHGWGQTQTDVLRMALYWGAFSGIDLICGWIAFRLDKRRSKFAPVLLLSQRFVYRQLMYGVVIRAVSTALHGVGSSWGKQERSGRVDTGELLG